MNTAIIPCATDSSETRAYALDTEYTDFFVNVTSAADSILTRTR